MKIFGDICFFSEKDTIKGSVIAHQQINEEVQRLTIWCDAFTYDDENINLGDIVCVSFVASIFDKTFTFIFKDFSYDFKYLFEMDGVFVCDLDFTKADLNIYDGEKNIGLMTTKECQLIEDKMKEYFEV